MFATLVIHLFGKSLFSGQKETCTRPTGAVVLLTAVHPPGISPYIPSHPVCVTFKLHVAGVSERVEGVLSSCTKYFIIHLMSGSYRVRVTVQARHKSASL